MIYITARTATTQAHRQQQLILVKERYDFICSGCSTEGIISWTVLQHTPAPWRSNHGPARQLREKYFGLFGGSVGLRNRNDKLESPQQQRTHYRGRHTRYTYMYCNHLNRQLFSMDYRVYRSNAQPPRLKCKGRNVLELEETGDRRSPNHDNPPQPFHHVERDTTATHNTTAVCCSRPHYGGWVRRWALLPPLLKSTLSTRRAYPTRMCMISRCLLPAKCGSSSDQTMYDIAR